MPECRLCGTEFKNRIRIEGKVHVMGNRKFCLTCSPFKQHNTKELTTFPPSGTRPCSRCKQVLPLSDFYTRRATKNASVYCKPCTNQQAVERQQKLKQDAAAYLGGCCSQCGYNRYAAALELHHRDPSAKEFSLCYSKSTTFDKIKPELNKCILLCANCHREEHARQKGLITSL